VRTAVKTEAAASFDSGVTLVCVYMQINLPEAPNFNYNVSHEGHFVVLASEPHTVCGVDCAAPSQLRRGKPQTMEDIYNVRPCPTPPLHECTLASCAPRAHLRAVRLLHSGPPAGHTPRTRICACTTPPHCRGLGLQKRKRDGFFPRASASVSTGIRWRRAVTCEEVADGGGGGGICTDVQA
jgi:hypothetical protein